MQVLPQCQCRMKASWGVVSWRHCHCHFSRPYVLLLLLFVFCLKQHKQYRDSASHLKHGITRSPILWRYNRYNIIYSGLGQVYAACSPTHVEPNDQVEHRNSLADLCADASRISGSHSGSALQVPRCLFRVTTKCSPAHVTNPGGHFPCRIQILSSESSNPGGMRTAGRRVSSPKSSYSPLMSTLGLH